ncbi:MAG: FAD-dependent monooxygenase [Hydrogenophaga sp.]|jgi:salicylate hydroxylase|uniref:FAD-dependent monooxygenase n=1 Tax=Hydrogenophaga sp. TaxID=1904254 RepID=UPI0026024E22|nr:FAD-dependent monooxygenase [Hydrogenophaga sp.]MCV0437194.1 FAD-dependent monooxygenase [Hydrogenophaga sp.]
MNQQVIVAGGGIGGLACALALSRAGVQVVVLEQAEAFGEVGAGLQLGPNAVRVLAEWGLMDALQACAAFPEALRVRDAHQSRQLGHLRLGAMALARHGQHYATLHRADLHGLLLAAVRRRPEARLMLGTRMASFQVKGPGVQVTLDNGEVLGADALIGCDGLWSRVRGQLLGDQPPRATGHLAYRGLVRAVDLPAPLRANVVTAWLGPRLHVVHYPVKQGDWINVVAVVEGTLAPGGDPHGWTHAAHAADLRRALGPACGELLAMIAAVPEWTLWPLHDRACLRGAHEQAQGPVALLGDAAHPMRPYLAQGAAMAIEDAWTLGQLAQAPAAQSDWHGLLAAYARTRWRRNARVQQISQRNGTVFHAHGALRWARDRAMGLLGERLLDNTWLYDGPPEPEPVTGP